MLSIIVAVGKGGVIGVDGRMPWHLADDLRRFRALTWGAVVVMGRRTYESIGRPLESRTTVVLSRQKNLCIEGVTVLSGLREALEMFAGRDIFVAGGGEIYTEALGLADRIYMTEVEGEWKGDTYFPNVDQRHWREVWREKHEGFEFVDYIKI